MLGQVDPLGELLAAELDLVSLPQVTRALAASRFVDLADRRLSFRLNGVKGSSRPRS